MSAQQRTNSRPVASVGEFTERARAILRAEARRRAIAADNRAKRQVRALLAGAARRRPPTKEAPATPRAELRERIEDYYKVYLPDVEDRPRDADGGSSNKRGKFGRDTRLEDWRRRLNRGER